MKLLEVRLRNAGYQVHNLAYPRRVDSIEEIVESLHASYLECCNERAGRLHFVTHSLGGLVARAYIEEHPPPNLGRVVMLAPPNGGSEIVDQFRDWEVFGAVLGPLAPQLGTGPVDLPARLGVPRCEIGIIAGDRWVNPLGPIFLTEPHDGTVSVDRTYLPGMKDHLVVPHTHTFIMNSSRVAREIVHFLRSGQFEGHEENPSG